VATVSRPEVCHIADAADRLGLIVSAWTEMLQRGSIRALAEVLSPDVIWQGVLPDQVCRNREEVLSLVGRPGRRPRRLTRLEAEEIGDRVVVSVEGPDFPPLDGQPVASRRSLVFTFADGRIVRIESTPTRERAFEIARTPA